MIVQEYLSTRLQNMTWNHIGLLNHEMIWTSSPGTRLGQQSARHINSRGLSDDWYPSYFIQDQWVFIVQRPAL